MKKGVAGAVVHGACRDTDAIRELGFPVWATHISVEQPEMCGPAAVNVPIVADNVLVEPGDIVAADADGVVVIPRAGEMTKFVGATSHEARLEPRHGRETFPIAIVSGRTDHGAPAAPRPLSAVPRRLGLAAGGTWG